jgi:hypothetical protein
MPSMANHTMKKGIAAERRCLKSFQRSH